MTKASVIAIFLSISFLISFSFNSNSFNLVSNNDSPHPNTTVPDRSPVKPTWKSMYESLDLKSKGLSEKAFALAYFGFNHLDFSKPILAIADFSQSSTKKRLYIIDLIAGKILFNTYVAHGRNSGDEFAKKFSNRNESYQSSLGFYRTLSTYQGKHGLSLKMQGLEKGINDNALTRAIVLHGAEYVSETFIKNTGRLGRSLGCPAVSMADHKKVIALLNDGAGFFIYSNDNQYQQASSFNSDSELNTNDLTKAYTASK